MQANDRVAAFVRLAPTVGSGQGSYELGYS